MTITVFGASGHVGKYVISKALAWGHTVVAFGRNVEPMIDADLSNDKFKVIKGYVFDKSSVFEAIKGSDAVISVLGGAADGSDKTRSLGIKNIVEQMQKAGVNRIIALGNIAILNAFEDDAETIVLDTDEYPDEFRAVGEEHLAAYEILKSSNLDWTMVAAPNILEDKSNGAYKTVANYQPQNANGEIYAGDLAEFMVKEVSNNNFLRQKVGISNY